MSYRSLTISELLHDPPWEKVDCKPVRNAMWPLENGKDNYLTGDKMVEHENGKDNYLAGDKMVEHLFMLRFQSSAMLFPTVRLSLHSTIPPTTALSPKMH